MSSFLASFPSIPCSRFPTPSVSHQSSSLAWCAQCCHRSFPQAHTAKFPPSYVFFFLYLQTFWGTVFFILGSFPSMEQCVEGTSKLSFTAMRSKAGKVANVKCGSEQGHLGATYTLFLGMNAGYMRESGLWKSIRLDSYNLGASIYLTLQKNSQKRRALAVTLLVRADTSITSLVSITIEHLTSQFYLWELILPILSNIWAKDCIQGWSMQLYSKLPQKSYWILIYRDWLAEL